MHCLALPTPFPVGPVNGYLAGGDPLTLVDTGPKADVTRAALEAALAARGQRVEDVRRLIITHHHVDHMGLAGEIVARSGAQVWAHPYSVPWLTDYGAQLQRNRPFFRQLWGDSGIPAEVVTHMEAASSGLERWVDPVVVDRTLGEADEFEMDGHAWTVFHTPGHAGGLICLWEPDTRTLLANDHMLNDITSNPVLEPPPLSSGPRPRRLVEYLHHLRRMGALSPSVALAGHGEPVSDVAGLVRQRVAFHERRAQRILSALARQPQTLWEVTQLLFPRLGRGMDYFLALSEVLGHLDLLEEQGRACPNRVNGVVRWAPV